MKIYCVKHHYDNGEYGEDYRADTDLFLFSTIKKATNYYYSYVAEDFEGKYELVEWELDTQDQKVLEETPYVPCTPYDPYEDDLYDEEPDMDYDNYQLVPEDSIQSYWKWCDEWHGEIIPENPQCDDIAREFCKEWNENLDNEECLKELVHTYDKIFQSIGYLSTWYNYKKAIGIPDFDLIELNSFLNQLV